LFTLSIDTLAGGTGQTCSLGEGLDASAFDLNSIGLPVSTHAADDWNPNVRPRAPILDTRPTERGRLSPLEHVG
jgi:hypothetical protein